MRFPDRLSRMDEPTGLGVGTRVGLSGASAVPVHSTGLRHPATEGVTTAGTGTRRSAHFGYTAARREAEG